jgi:predicted nucleic acid-binding protein
VPWAIEGVEAVLDTNVLLYAASKDPSDQAKAEIGLPVLGRVNFGLPLQVVQDDGQDDDGVRIVNPFKELG